MQTIFDFSPTQTEVQEIAFDYLTMGFRMGERATAPSKEWYIKHIKKEWAIFDIALLFTYRKDEAKANEAWAKIPDIHAEYLLGKDYEQVADAATKKDFNYYQQIANSADYNHPEREYARELMGFADGEGFMFNNVAYYGKVAILQLEILLKEAATKKQKIVAVLKAGVFDGTPDLHLQ